MPGMPTQTRTRSRKAQLDPAELMARDAMALLMRVLNWRDEDVCIPLGVTRSAASARRKGDTRIRPGDIEAMAAAFGVDADVFRMDQRQVMRYLSEHSGWVARDLNPEPADTVATYSAAA